MSTRNKITRTSANGHDRIEWHDENGLARSARPTDSSSVDDVRPAFPVRRFGKWDGQTAWQGHYWCVGTQTLVPHESLMELTSLMMLDHFFDIVDVHAQPVMFAFADGGHHVPDYMVDTAQGERIIVDIHDEDMTTDSDRRLFELTAGLCDKVGWRFELMGVISDIRRWNLEMMARYKHPRYAPDEVTRARILKLARKCGTFGVLRAALTTPLPGEHLPALFHLMWNRAVRFDLERRFSDLTRLHVV